MAFPTQITVQEAIDLISEWTPSGAAEEQPLDLCLNRILAGNLSSLVDHPTVDNSAMDGFACRHADTGAASAAAPVRLEIAGEVPAGRPFEGRVEPGQAVRIYTGGAVPDGADAIIPVEYTRERGNEVELLRPATGADIRPRGQDLRAGETYLETGTRLGAAELGLAAAMGHPTVPVTRRPRIGILATGSEVIEPGRPLSRGQVYNANGFTIAGMVRAAGGEAVILPPVPDDPAKLEQALETRDRLDLLITSGGVSMGRYDLVRDLLLERGQVAFWKVAMRPGGPVMFGRWRGLAVLGLPGNPVSSMVVLLVLGRAFIDRFLGLAGPLPYRQREVATAGQTFRASGAKETFHRVQLDRSEAPPLATTTGNQSSGVLRSMAAADALAILPGHAEFEPGDSLEVLPLKGHLG